MTTMTLSLSTLRNLGLRMVLRWLSRPRARVRGDPSCQLNTSRRAASTVFSNFSERGNSPHPPDEILTEIAAQCIRRKGSDGSSVSCRTA